MPIDKDYYVSPDVLAAASNREEALEWTIGHLREELAGAYAHPAGIRLVHWSHCATSMAPALKPGPCDCGAVVEFRKAIGRD